ncbi:MAG: 50S ribosomal protein L29 [Bacteroidales bacterium]|nr:50S ribosomal protein L29 [Bacteroidales bacterium]
MKISEIRELATNEIEERIDNEENMLVRMKMNHAVSPLDNPNKIRVTRRIIARLKTELRSRKSAEQKES